jgi:hypothetical protein
VALQRPDARRIGWRHDDPFDLQSRHDDPFDLQSTFDEHNGIAMFSGTGKRPGTACESHAGFQSRAYRMLLTDELDQHELDDACIELERHDSPGNGQEAQDDDAEANYQLIEDTKGDGYGAIASAGSRGLELCKSSNSIHSSNSLYASPPSDTRHWV